MRFLAALLCALLSAVCGADALAQSTVRALPTPTTSPMPANSCMYVVEGPGPTYTNTKACDDGSGVYWANLLRVAPRTSGTSLLAGDGSGGFVNITPGTGLSLS